MDATVCRERWAGLQSLEPSLRAFLGRRCRDQSEMDDVIQETYLRAARYRRSLTDPERLRGWALRIAANVLRDHIRRGFRTPRADLDDDLLENLPGREPSPGELADDVSLRLGTHVLGSEPAFGQLQAALRAMREEDQQVLRSYYAGNKSCARTAEECGIPAELVKVRLFRARRRLARALDQRLTREAGRLERSTAAPMVPAS